MPRRFLILSIVLALAILIGALVAVRKTLPPRVPEDTEEALQTSTSLIEPTIAVTDPIRGNASAPNTVVVYSDFECPYCADAAETLNRVLEEYEGRVRVVWKDAPNTTLHFRSLGAHVAARCAQAQEKFWEFHDMLFANQDKLTVANYTGWAGALRMDTARFEQCLSLQQGKELVQQNRLDAERVGVDATPYFFVNGERIAGAVSFEEFERIISTL